MTVTHPRTVIAAMALTILGLLLTILFVHADIYPVLHTYGVSVGTSGHYCSFELVRSHLALSCETAR